MRDRFLLPFLPATIAMTTLMTQVNSWLLPMNSLMKLSHIDDNNNDDDNHHHHAATVIVMTTNNNNIDNIQVDRTIVINRVMNDNHDYCSSSIDSNSSSMHLYECILSFIVIMYVIYSSSITIYYTVLYAPLYADVDTSIIDVLIMMLSKPYYHPSSKEVFKETLQFMHHFGLDR
jgi:hypothetical protein